MARYGYEQYKDIVGKAVRMKNTKPYEDARGFVHYCDWNPGITILAYCKGKNGQYYLGKGWSKRYTVYRVQRITQRDNYDIIDYIPCSIEGDEAYEPETVTDEVLERFQDVVELHKPFRYKRSGPRDRQRQKVYRWETAAAEAADIEGKRYKKEWHLSREDSLALVKKISDWAGIRAPDVKYKPGASYSWASGTRLIQLASTTPDTIIHEMCHIIATHLSHKLIEAHGPEFVGLLMYMNEVFLGWPIDKAVKVAIEHKVRYDFAFKNVLQEQHKVAA